jgi:iron only hydrogenase large subunit-like protein
MSFFEAIGLALTKKEVESSSLGVILSSHCPGFSLYAEKTQKAEFVGRMSRVRSADQICGVILKSVIQNRFKSRLFIGQPTKLIFHVTVSPCYDKKLEILRDQYKGSVDLVLTTNELLEILTLYGEGLEGGDEGTSTVLRLFGFEKAFSGVKENNEGGGYAQQLLSDNFSWESLRNRDLSIAREDKLMRAYGFRNIQNIVRRFTSQDLSQTTRFVEVMACPGACALGGGQPVVKDDSKEKVASSWWGGRRRSKDANLVHAEGPDAFWLEFILSQVKAYFNEPCVEKIFSAEWKALETSSPSLKW